MQKRENPTVGKRQGFKKRISGKEKNTSYPPAGQVVCAMRPLCEFRQSKGGDQ